ncbi:MAG: hypothetical protein ACLTAO_09330 [Christensenellales bacterium]
MRNERGALHMEVLSAIPGRIRVQLERPIETDAPFARINGVISCNYNPRIFTLTCLYDQSLTDEDKLIAQMGAVYAGMVSTRLLHIKRSEEEGFSMAPSGYLALACIGLDWATGFTASSLTSLTRWLSVGSTLAAVIEHGYQELHVRGSFDPEVMSVVYLINSIGKPNTHQASLIAWAMTFGRHLIPHEPREQVYLVRSAGSATTITPVKGNESEAAYAGNMLRRGVEMLARR